MNIPEINRIVIDMDGVIVDDVEMFSHQDRLIPDMKSHIEILKIFGMKQSYIFPLINEAIRNKGFLKAKPTLFLTVLTDLLLPYWESKGITVEILSSTMRENPLRKNLEEQKIQWLKDHKLGHLPVNLVHGSMLKQEYATKGVLLIDDYDRTIGQFISRGGYGIQYTTLNEVMHKLRLIGLSPDTK